ncbi:ankyrin repeat-containing protein kinase A-like [Oppia nitens]|uniref:ankyrin repeat-containing protein kinase A-like n=1 Tax=Oppia nitens TaxID=1686743 RepID=UPI0023D9C141|nr:ankyrin repeat-containing protein kinase A-like [Oppia nitens]
MAYKSSLVISHCIDGQAYDVINYLLVNSLIDINEVINQYGWTAIHKAVYTKDIDLIVLLIKYEVNINVVDINGNTPLHILFQPTSPHLITINNKPYPDFGVNNHCLIVILKLLLYYCKSQNINILNKQNKFGKTALHYAVVNIGFTAPVMLVLIDLLLDSGCDPNARDRLNRTPLFCVFNEFNVCEKIKRQIILKLLESGADPLNLYQFKSFIGTFTLKQLSRQCLLRNNCVKTLQQIYNNLPQELISYLSVTQLHKPCIKLKA